VALTNFIDDDDDDDDYDDNNNNNQRQCLWCYHCDL